MLQYVAICCNILQYIAIYCNILQYFAIYCNILQYIAIYCNVLQYIAIYCNILVADAAASAPADSERSHERLQFASRCRAVASRPITAPSADGRLMHFASMQAFDSSAGRRAGERCVGSNANVWCRCALRARQPSSPSPIGSGSRFRPATVMHPATATLRVAVPTRFAGSQPLWRPCCPRAAGTLQAPDISASTAWPGRLPHPSMD